MSAGTYLIDYDRKSIYLTGDPMGRKVEIAIAVEEARGRA